ncbi:Fe-S oxidoreductase family 2 [Eggerthella sp. YY7918]|nr:Fe-S oxidoreductase family 2 [Eggerthella sp. YY7918]
MLAQCFWTIDPVMLRLFPSIDMGNGRLVTLPWNIAGYPNNQFLECSDYNYQAAFFDDALDKAYAEMDLANSKVMIFDGYRWGTEGDTLNSIIGYGFYSVGLWSTWNEENECRELTADPTASVDPLPISSVSDVEKCIDEFQHVYYIELPWGDMLANELKESSLNCELLTTVNYGGWLLNVYQFT